MRENPYYGLKDIEEIKRLIEENPWATLVSHTSAGLVASHYPILVDHDYDGLSVLTHLGRPDDRVHELPNHEALIVVQGPHGYISSSWYGDHVEVPTWNFIAAHLSGVPEILSDEQNSAVLHRLVAHFEDRLARPRLLDGTPADAENARTDMRGTVGLRLTPTRIVAKRKMSQNQTPEIVDAVLAELESDGPYASPSLAREMRLANAPGDLCAARRRSAVNLPDGQEIRPATPQDLAALLRMLDEAVAWMVARGQPGQWGTEPWSAAEKGRRTAREIVDSGGMYVLELDGEVAGAVAVGEAFDYAEPVDVPELFIRLLITSRAYAGRSLGQALIAKARELAGERGAELLRVDCWAGAPTLVAWYESCGFKRAHTFDLDGWHGQVLEQAV